MVQINLVNFICILFLGNIVKVSVFWKECLTNFDLTLGRSYLYELYSWTIISIDKSNRLWRHIKSYVWPAKTKTLEPRVIYGLVLNTFNFSKPNVPIQVIHHSFNPMILFWVFYFIHNKLIIVHARYSYRFIYHTVVQFFLIDDQIKRYKDAWFNLSLNRDLKVLS